MAGLELGDIIRKEGLNTSIGRTVPLEGITDNYTYETSYCLSACAYAFLGGVSRDYDKNSVYGIHRFGSDRPISGEDAQVVTSIIAKYIQQMGVDLSVLRAASLVPFNGDIFAVPVGIAKTMRIIYDPSGRASFVVEQRGSRTVAVFQTMKGSLSYNGELSCEAGKRIMRIYDIQGIVPDLLKESKNYPVEVEVNGKKVSGVVSYERTNPANMTLYIPEMNETSFAGRGFMLEMIYNPHLAAMKSSSKEKGSAVSPKFVEMVTWLDAVHKFSFNLVADNGERTLPIVFRDCK
jgi:hypothetical protein